MAEYLSRIRHDRHWQTVAATRIRFRSVRAGVGLDSIAYHWQIVLCGHRGSQVRCLKLRFWCSSGKRLRTCPLLCLRIPHLKDHGVPRNQVSSIRGRYSTLHGDPLPAVPSRIEALSQCVSALTLWFLDNGLQLNSTKSEAMILGSKKGFFQVGARRLVEYRRWSCGGQGRNQNTRCSSGPNLVIERPSEVVDEDLQIPHPCSPTCSVRSDFRICQRWSPSVSSLLDSIIVNHSCMALQRRTSEDSIQRVQNDLAQVVLQFAWNSSSKPLLKHLHWLPVQQRKILKIALVTFNVRTFEQPSYLHSLLDNYIPSRNLRSEGQHLLRIPFQKSAAARRSFAFAAPTVWNILNSSTLEATSIGTFKTRLKTELFLSAFPWTSTALLPCNPPSSYLTVLTMWLLICSIVLSEFDPWLNPANPPNVLLICGSISGFM